MDERFWDPRLETLPVEQRRPLQDHRLRWQFRRCWDGSPFYRARLEAAGLEPSSFAGLADLCNIPIVRADDLPRGERTDDLPRGERTDEASREWTVAPEDWWREHARSDDGIARVLTEGDLTHGAHRAARAIWAAGSRAERSLAALAEQPLPVDALAIAGVASAAGYSCGKSDGVHWNDDHVLIEVVDRASGEPVSAGEVGAVLVTDLTREGSPLVRFWAGLEAALIEESCPCGRTSARSPSVRPLP